MTRPRSELVCPAATPWYHCVCRCVRRAFLCGEDHLTGNDYSHRKAWVLERLGLLAEIFTIDLGAYAVMANHYHLVVRLDTERAAALSDHEVIARWNRLFSLPLLVSRYQGGGLTTEAEIAAAQAIVGMWRQRLCDLSWYMRCLNEHLARLANSEDGCKGRFWEGRYKSQAILDEAGLLACLVYVDLNPLRAAVVDTPEKSADVSLHQRMQPEPKEPEATRPALLPFVGGYQKPMSLGIPYDLIDYLQLTDWTGRAQRPDKRGHIDEQAPAILSRLGMDGTSFLEAVARQRLSQGSVIGHPQACRQHAQQFQRRRLNSPLRAVV